MINCREIISLPVLAKIKIVAGESGLDREIRWVHFIDLPDVLPWLQGGELLIITGIGLNGEAERLADIVRGAAAKNLAGLIVNVGPYIDKIPPMVAQLADELGFPVFELPWEVKLVEVTQAICSYIVTKQTEEKSVADVLENILFNTVNDPELLVRRAAFYGYNLTGNFQVAVVRADNLETLVTTRKFMDEKVFISMKMRFEQSVREAYIAFGYKVPSSLRMNSVILLLPQRDSRRWSSIDDVFTALSATLAMKVPGLKVSVGLGGAVGGLSEVRRSFKQAQQALMLAEFIPNTRQIYEYDTLGIYKLLFEMDQNQLKAYHAETLGVLTAYDRKHKTELIASLTGYFDEKGNVGKAARRLFVHRNTMEYRLNKIEELTGKSLGNPHNALELHLAIIIGKQFKL